MPNVSTAEAVMPIARLDRTAFMGPFEDSFPKLEHYHGRGVPTWELGRSGRRPRSPWGHDVLVLARALIAYSDTLNSKQNCGGMLSEPWIRSRGLKSRRWNLVTGDAHGLYRQFGFTSAVRSERYMERLDPDIYKR